MTTLVIGASGQVGALLYESCSRTEVCVGTYWNHCRPGLVRLDLRDHARVADLVEQVRPAVCYLPAAWTFVDGAEVQAHQCRLVNVVAVENLARSLAAVAATLVLFSTEHVFGTSPRPRREEEATAAAGVYARSKAEAEEVVRAILPGRHVILRTSWVYGPDPQGKNFFCRVRRTLEKNERLIVASDQHGQPTYGPDLAEAARELAARQATGTYHVVGPEELSRLAWARLIAEELGLPAQLIEGQATASLPAVAPRPLRVPLDRRKLLQFLGRDPIRPPRQGVRDAHGNARLTPSCNNTTASRPTLMTPLT